MNRTQMVAPFAEEELQSFKGRGNQTMTYIEDETVMDRLDVGYGFGNWQVQVDPVSESVVKVRLGVREAGEWIWYEDFGYPNREGGESLKEAVSDGIRRCGRYVGIARDLYRRSPDNHRADSPPPAQRAPDPHPSRVDRSTGEVRPQVETETLIGGPVRRTGKIAKGDGAGSDLQYRMGPEGHSLHFRLEIAGKNDDGTPKNIPQVWAEGELGETMFAAGIDPEKLKGEKASCTGLVYAVAFPGRRTFHRMKLSRIEVADLIIPPADVSALRALPDAPEAVPEPLRPEDAAELDALEVPWPDGVMA